MSDALSAPTILTPHALPMFRDGEMIGGTKRKREKDRMDPRKSRRPELPVTGPGRGGRVGASATQHVVQNLVRDTTRDQDVRPILVHLYRSFVVGSVMMRSYLASFIKPSAHLPNEMYTASAPVLVLRAALYTISLLASGLLLAGISVFISFFSR